MSTITTRNALVKPDYTDAADVAVINGSLDTIDAAIAKCNYAGTAAPSTANDSSQGYSIGSVWIDRTNNNIYVAKTVTVGAAVWTLQALHNNFSATTAPAVGNDITQHYAPGSMWVDITNHNVYVCEVNSVGAAVWKQVNSASISGYIKADGTVPLTAAWDAGSYQIRAETFQSDVATGTAPFTVASTTQVANLKAATCGLADNSSQLNGIADTGYVKQTLADAKGDIIVASGNDAWARMAAGTDGQVLMTHSGATNGAAWVNITSGLSRNMIINGDFAVNQTGIATYTNATNPINSDDKYLHDQWTLLSDGNDIVNVFSAGYGTLNPTGHASGMKFAVVTTNKKFGYIQFIESKNAAVAIGGVVSLRFWTYTPAGNAIDNIMAGVLSWSSTADTLTSDVVSAWNATNVAPTLISNWTFENTPSRLALTPGSWQEWKIENISIDTASTTNIAVFIWSDDTTTTVSDQLILSGVQLNLGAQCQPWGGTNYALEQAACTRHFYCINSAAGAYPHLGIGSANTTSAVYVEQHHPTEWFKTTPTMTMIGSKWVTAGTAISSYASEGDTKQITYRCTSTGTPFTLYLCYLVYANNESTARVYMESRL